MKKNIFFSLILFLGLLTTHMPTTTSWLLCGWCAVGGGVNTPVRPGGSAAYSASMALSGTPSSQENPLKKRQQQDLSKEFPTHFWPPQGALSPRLEQDRQRAHPSDSKIPEISASRSGSKHFNGHSKKEQHGAWMPAAILILPSEQERKNRFNPENKNNSASELSRSQSYSSSMSENSSSTIIF